MNLVRCDCADGQGFVVQALQYSTRCRGACWLAVKREQVAAIANLDIQPLFDLAQMCVKLATQGCEAMDVVGLKGYCQSSELNVQM